MKTPIEVGARVSIIRHRHGWEDGRLAGTVSSRHSREGGAFGYVVTTDDGGEYECRKTGDMRILP